MGTRLYPLSDENGDRIKIWYPLGFDIDMRMEINFFYINRYG